MSEEATTTNKKETITEGLTALINRHKITEELNIPTHLLSDFILETLVTVSNLQEELKNHKTRQPSTLFSVGDKVSKIEGNSFDGTVISVFQTLGGITKYVVEHSLFINITKIFYGDQLRQNKGASPSAPPLRNASQPGTQPRQTETHHPCPDTHTPNHHVSPTTEDVAPMHIVPDGGKTTQNNN